MKYQRNSAILGVPTQTCVALHLKSMLHFIVVCLHAKTKGMKLHPDCSNWSWLLHKMHGRLPKIKSRNCTTHVHISDGYTIVCIATPLWEQCAHDSLKG